MQRDDHVREELFYLKSSSQIKLLSEIINRDNLKFIKRQKAIYMYQMDDEKMNMKV